MRVTKWGECGILCSVYLAQRYGQGTVGALEISESQGLDIQYTQQILQRLRKGGVIESERGPRGGYRLARAPDKITLKDILYATEGDTFQIICDYAPIHPNAEDGMHCATKESCGLHGVWQDLRNAIDSLLDQKTLNDLVGLNTGSSETTLVQLSHRSQS
jgi:Rrf2 family iron-sulfur cluster assembly transcriptional regulator